MYLRCPERVTETEKEKEQQRSRGGSLGPLGGGGGHPGRRTRTLLLSDEKSERGNTDWTPPAKRAAADCFIKFQRLGGVGGGGAAGAFSCPELPDRRTSFETTYEYGSLEVRRDTDSKHAWRRCCRSVAPVYQATSRMMSSETGGVGTVRETAPPTLLLLLPRHQDG